MSNDRRVSRVASLIKREVSQMLMSGIKDDRVGGGMVSVTDVEVAGDLQHVKVFVSIYGDEAARDSTMEGLASATSYVRRELGKRVRLRRTPTVVFLEDQGIERGSGVLSLINQLALAREAKGPEPSAGDDGLAELEGVDELESIPDAEADLEP